MSGYLRPVDPTGICTYNTHTHRTIPSLEAGVDYYCPIGTPVHAAGPGVVVDVGGSIQAATGRYVTIDLDDGRRVRYLHLSKQLVRVGQRVGRGDVVGLSGASGYGSEYFGASSPERIPANTGGPHVHTTLWPHQVYQFGRFPLEPTLDFELYVSGGSTAGGGSSPFPKEWDEMATKQEITDVVRAVFREELSKQGADAAQAVQSIAFIDSQVNGFVAHDRPTERQLATAVARVQEILYAVDGAADPTVPGAPTRALARFLQVQGAQPSGTVDVDEAEIARLVVQGLAADLDSLEAAIGALPRGTVDELVKRLAG